MVGGRKIRVGVSGHDLKFWYPLQRALERTGKYEFREDVWSGHDSHNQATSEALLDWAEVLVAEWALGNAVWYSRRKRPHQRLLVRLHLQERGTRHPAEIDYANVERVVFVGEHILRECERKFSIPAGVCTVLGNFIDVGRYAQSKFGDAEYTLGMIGTAPSRKRLDLAVDTLELLARRDDRYRLRVKGASPASIPWLWARSPERDYYQRVYARINEGPLRYRVMFDPQGNDVHQWLRMVGAILSPSDFESFHMAVAEGAASGAVPVVWSWDGAASTYPEFPLVASPAEAADFIEFHNRSAAGARYRVQVQEAIRARYDASVVTARWDALLSGDAAAPRTQAPAGRNRDLLVVWAIDNWPTFHRREMLQALAANLQEHCDLLVVEPGNYLEAIGKLGWAAAEELERLAAGEVFAEAPNLFRTRLLTGGIPASMPTASFQASSSDPLRVLDGLVAARFPHARQVLHWVYKPDQAHKLGDARRFLYEVYDDYTIGFGSGDADERTQRLEEAVLPKAEHVFFTSAPLLARKGGAARGASLVGNGVDFAAFARHRVPRAARVGRPVAGYLGNLSDFFDWALMEEVCRAMPDVDFVFHGTIEAEKLGEARARSHEAMRALPNVRFTGRVSRPLGAAAVNRYDVLLIPFVVNAAMHAVNPLKLWEYFATGLPVVTSPMEAIEDGAPLLRVADGAREWAAAIADCLADADPAAAEARLARAQAHRWEHLTSAHAEVVRQLFEPRRGAPLVASAR